MNYVTYADYYAANMAVAFGSFLVGIAGAALSALWAFNRVRDAGHIRFLLAPLSGFAGFVNFWFIAAWATHALGLWEFEGAASVQFPWQIGAVWLAIMALTYSMDRLHQYSLRRAGQET